MPINEKYVNMRIALTLKWDRESETTKLKSIRLRDKIANSGRKSFS